LVLLFTTGALAQDAGTSDHSVASIVGAPVIVSPMCPPGPGLCVVGHRLTGAITPALVNETLRWLKEVQDSHAPIAMLELNTHGGDFDAGVELARAIESVRASVVCVVDGTAESMGFFLLQSCDVRVMTRRSSIMAHDPFETFSTNGQLTRAELLNLSEDLRVSARRFAEQAIRRMGISYKEYRARTAGGRDWHMHWEDALKFHAVDIATPRVPNQIFTALRRGEAF
jgi:ATP-dependent protease ClpP protease subunit